MCLRVVCARVSVARLLSRSRREEERGARRVARTNQERCPNQRPPNPISLCRQIQRRPAAQGGPARAARRQEGRYASGACPPAPPRPLGQGARRVERGGRQRARTSISDVVVLSASPDPRPAPNDSQPGIAIVSFARGLRRYTRSRAGGGLKPTERALGACERGRRRGVAGVVFSCARASCSARLCVRGATPGCGGGKPRWKT